MKTLFYNARLVDAYSDNDGAILIEDGFITNVFMGFLLPSIFKDFLSNISDIKLVDCKGLVLMPSFVDMHAHFRYPGQSHKEELSTALKAAVAGGFGTLLLMPNTSPVISKPEEAQFVQGRPHVVGNDVCGRHVGAVSVSFFAGHGIVELQIDMLQVILGEILLLEFVLDGFLVLIDRNRSNLHFARLAQEIGIGKL